VIENNIATSAGSVGSVGVLVFTLVVTTHCLALSTIVSAGTAV